MAWRLAAAVAAVVVYFASQGGKQQAPLPPLGSRRALLAAADPSTIDWISWAADKFNVGGSSVSPHISALRHGDTHHINGGYHAAKATGGTPPGRLGADTTAGPSRPAPPPALPAAPPLAPAPLPPPPIVLRSKLRAAFPHLEFPVASQREAEDANAVAARSRARPPAAAADQQQQQQQEHRAKVNARNRQTALTRSIGRAEKANTRKNPHAKNVRKVNKDRHSL